jgi:hypothetical protein
MRVILKEKESVWWVFINYEGYDLELQGASEQDPLTMPEGEA